MRKVILFIASSLDGYIADPSGEIDWLFTEGDYGYGEFYDRIDTILMGRLSFEKLLSFGGDYPHQDRKNYIFTRNPEKYHHPHACFINTPPSTLIKTFKESPGKDIWLVGGGALIAEFLRDDLIDEFVISIHPVILGKGIPLFLNQESSRWLRLKESKAFETGLLQICYEKQ